MEETVTQLHHPHRKEHLMREKQVEQRLVRAVKAAGGLCPKFVSPGMDGMPDRLALMGGGHLGFIEVKAPGKKPRPLQVMRHKQLRDLGFPVYVLDDPEQIPIILSAIRGGQTDGCI